MNAVLLLLTFLLGGSLAGAQPSVPKTALEMKVRGILAIGEGDDRRSSAIIAMKDGGQGRTYSPGQLIDDNPDLKLVRVQDERIEFLNHGQLEFAPVKRFPDAGTASSASSAYSPPDNKAADSQAAPRTPSRRPRPPRPSKAGQDDAIVPSVPDSQ
jgi:hypothetical protein